MHATYLQYQSISESEVHKIMLEKFLADTTTPVDIGTFTISETTEHQIPWVFIRASSYGRCEYEWDQYNEESYQEQYTETIFYDHWGGKHKTSGFDYIDKDGRKGAQFMPTSRAIPWRPVPETKTRTRFRNVYVGTYDDTYELSENTKVSTPLNQKYAWLEYTTRLESNRTVDITDKSLSSQVQQLQANIESSVKNKLESELKSKVGTSSRIHNLTVRCEFEDSNIIFIPVLDIEYIYRDRTYQATICLCDKSMKCYNPPTQDILQSDQYTDIVSNLKECTTSLHNNGQKLTNLETTCKQYESTLDMSAKYQREAYNRIQHSILHKLIPNLNGSALCNVYILGRFVPMAILSIYFIIQVSISVIHFDVLATLITLILALLFGIETYVFYTRKYKISQYSNLLAKSKEQISEIKIICQNLTEAIDSIESDKSRIIAQFQACKMKIANLDAVEQQSYLTELSTQNPEFLANIMQ